MQKLRMALLGVALAGGLFALAPHATALDADEMFADPAKEARAREIGRSLRCVVCQNQSIFDSNADLAKDLRNLVRERIDAGDSDEQAIAHIAERYGDFVLLEPRMKAGTVVLWAAPLLFIGLGLVMVLSYHRGRRSAPAAKLDPEQRAEARRLLSGDPA